MASRDKEEHGKKPAQASSQAVANPPQGFVFNSRKPDSPFGPILEGSDLYSLIATLHLHNEYITKVINNNDKDEYVLERLKKIKEMLEEQNEKLNEKLEKIDEKLDKQLVLLEQMTKVDGISAEREATRGSVKLYELDEKLDMLHDKQLVLLEQMTKVDGISAEREATRGSVKKCAEGNLA